jgi:hypothetical protein
MGLAAAFLPFDPGHHKSDFLAPTRNRLALVPSAEPPCGHEVLDLIASPETVFQDKPHFQFGIVPTWVPPLMNRWFARPSAGRKWLRTIGTRKIS